MKKLFVFMQVFTLFFSLDINVALRAQNFKLIDINKAKGSYSSSPGNSWKEMFAELNGIFYFSADDGKHGGELWCSDGTGKGTKLVKDIFHGFASSNPSEIITSGNKLYFKVFSPKGLPQIWISDGTDAGTKMVAEFDQGIWYSPLWYLTDVNGKVYFVNAYYDSSSTWQNQLWKTDGTEGGTVMVANLSTKDIYQAGPLVSVNTKLFFTGYSNSGAKLYISDGTTAGTKMVSGTYNYPSGLTSLNGVLYFVAADESNNNFPALWATDGTENGTHILKNTKNIFVAGSNSPFTAKNNTLFFQGGMDSTGYELCMYNTADASSNIELIKDINPGLGSAYPALITDVNGTLFFTAAGENGHPQLWKSDGTKDGTALVKDNIKSAYGFTNANGTLMFRSYRRKHGHELWKSDGTDSGTNMIKDIFRDAGSSSPSFLTYKNGILLFQAYDEREGGELWTSDGTRTGTVMVKNINNASTSGSSPSGYSVAGNKVVFSAFTDTYGVEPWVTDGTQEGTQLFEDIYPGTAGSYHYFLTSFKKKTFFLTSGESGLLLKQTDGTQAGTSVFWDLKNDYGVYTLVNTENSLYLFLFNNNTYRLELWRSDGTQAGTKAIKKDIDPSYFGNPTPVGNTVFFSSYDQAHGFELWKTDGTSAGTVLVKDIYPGHEFSSPSKLYGFNGKLFFVAYNGIGNFLWTSDGTESGTKLVMPIFSLGFARTRDKLFFGGFSTLGKGYELYTTDGTRAGTVLVKDINRGPGSSFNENRFLFTSGDSLVYFWAEDRRNGTELWRTNGTKEGTYLVKNITSGSNDSYINEMVNVHDKLFFTLYDTLWQSDGTKKGTYKVKDENLKRVRNFYGLTAINDDLYFSGYNPDAGQELYIGNITNFFTSTETIAGNILAVPKIDETFLARLLSNPVGDALKFMVDTKVQQPVSILITDVSGKTLVNEKQILSPGANIFSYNTKTWARGLYMIRIGTAGSSSLLKAVK